MKNKTAFWLSMLLSLALTACGGGGGDDDGFRDPDDGAPRAPVPPDAGEPRNPITVIGPITAFGSIIVNGIRFDTAGARVEVDGRPADTAQLKLGMVVTVQGLVDDSGTRGVADQIVFDDDVEGPIEAIDTVDADRKVLTVLGRRVAVDRNRTVFHGVGFDTLAVDQLVEVSGVSGSDGVIEATSLERKSERFEPGASFVEVKGTVDSVTGTTFQMGRFTVDFSRARLEKIPGGQVLAGMFVEVKGTLSGERIDAVEVELEGSRYPGDDSYYENSGYKVSLEGPITDFVDRSNFRVLGQRVDASAAYLEPPGLQLQDGLWVEVEGPIVGGVLQAYEVEAEGARSGSSGGSYGRVELEARIASVDPGAGVLTLDFVPGLVTVTVSPQTYIYDERGGYRRIGLADLRPGDYVEVKGAETGPREVAAGQIERDYAEADQVQAAVTECVPGERIVLLGLTYRLQDGVTRYDDVRDSGAFCSFLNAVGGYAEVEDWYGRRDGIADEVDLEGGYDDYYEGGYYDDDYYEGGYDYDDYYDYD